MAYSNREKIIGCLRKPTNPSSVIDFIPFEYSDRILGFYCGTALSPGDEMYWRVHGEDVPVKMLNCEVSTGTTGFRAKMATKERDDLITRILDIDPHSGQLKYLRTDNDLQAVRFQPPLNVKVVASTFGSQIKFPFDCLNVSKTGLLLASNRASERAPFIEGTLLELTIQFNESLMPVPVQLMGKVMRVDKTHADYALGHQRQFFGVSLVGTFSDSEKGVDWPTTLAEIEKLYIQTFSMPQAA